jgi:hypothetical protein
MKPRARTEKKADDAAGFEQGTIGRVTLSMGDGSSGGARDKSWEGSVQSRAGAYRSGGSAPGGWYLPDSYSHDPRSGRGNQHMCAPPLREKSAPVANAASSEASHATMEAISAGLPRRFMGIESMMRSSTSGRTAASISVSM